MSTIEQTRADRSRDAVNQTIDRAHEARADVKAQNAQQTKRAGGVKAVILDGVDSSRPAEGAAATLHEAGVIATTTGPNPFTTLRAAAGQDATPRFFLADAVAMEQELGPETRRLVLLGALEIAAQARGDAKARDAVAKARVGTQLVMADDDAIAAETLGQAHGAAKTVGQKLVEHISELKSDKQAKVLLTGQAKSASASFPPNMDANAFVQAVLRESYMLQNDIVKDIAMELDAVNKQRKAYRDKIARLRELKAKLKDGLTDEELAELAELGIDVGQKKAGASYTWDQDPELKQAEANLAAAHAKLDALMNPAKTSDAAPSATVYSPAVDAEVVSQFGSTTSTNALFEAIRAAYQNQRPYGEHNREDVFVYAFDGKTQLNDQKLNAKQVAQALAVYTANLPDNELVDMLNTLFLSASGQAGKESATNGPIFQTFCRSLSASQVEMLQRTNAGLFAKVDDASGGALTAVLDQQAELKRFGLTSDQPQLQRAYQLFMAASRSELSDPALVGALQEVLGGLSGPQAREFLSKIKSSYPGGVSADRFDLCVTACDPNQLFAGATPQELLYFNDAGTASASIFGLWANASTPESAADLTPEQQAAAIDVAKAEVTAAQAKVDAMTAARAEAETAATAQHFADSIGESIDVAIEKLNGDIESAGGDAQLLQLRLQEAMQRKQEFMQMMSNISKMMHETIMAIIRNIGG